MTGSARMLLRLRPVLNTALLAALCALVLAAYPRPAVSAGPVASRADRLLSRLPVTFIENRGQLAGAARFYLEGCDKSLYFTPGGVSFVLNGAQGARQRWTVRMEFAGARAVEPVGEEQAQGRVSYFHGKPSEWKTGVPTFTRIVYRELWPGIDLVCRGTKGRMKYEFRVRPGADPAQIRMRYTGADTVRVTERGDLEVSTPLGSFTDERPMAWQDGAARTVAVSYRAEAGGDGARQVSFHLGDYDRTRALVVDPSILLKCGFVGSALVLHMDVDATGAAYLTGFAPIRDPESTVNSAGPLGLDDGVVVKVLPDASALDYVAYFGGDDSDFALSLAVTPDGAAYVGGYTMSHEDTFPVRPHAGLSATFQGGETDAFLLRLTPDGRDLDFCGYLGGNRWDMVTRLKLGPDASVYMLGVTESSEDTFPVRVGPGLRHWGLGRDVYVAKLLPGDAGLAYCGYIGGYYEDETGGLAVDAAGCAYVAGYTVSGQSSFPVRGGPDLTYNDGHYSGDGDAFVAKVCADGSGLVYCGYIGGSHAEYATGIAVDASGRAYVTGTTRSTERTFPVRVGPDLTFNGGYQDGWIARVRADGLGLEYCGYIGGPKWDWVGEIQLDTAGNADVVGTTESPVPSLPMTGGPDLTFRGNADGLVVRVHADGRRLDYGGYIGGRGYDTAISLVPDGQGNFWIHGATGSPDWFPLLSGPRSETKHNSVMWIAKVSAFSPATPPYPRLQINPGRVDFGHGPTGTTRTRVLRLENRGRGVLTVTVPSLPQPFATTPTGPLTVAPRQSARLRVSFQPAETGVFHRTLAMTSSDPRSPLVQIPITGRAR